MIRLSALYRLFGYGYVPLGELPGQSDYTLYKNISEIRKSVRTNVLKRNVRLRRKYRAELPRVRGTFY